jgi:phosphoserine aminotransferase
MSVMEMSHRSAAFQEIIDAAEADLRDLMGIPDNYRVLFMQGGATLQFAGIPMNLTKGGHADYIVSGSWSKKAAKEAKMYTDVNILASSEDKNFSYVPDVDSLEYNPNADYVYICQNETIYGTKYSKLPNVGDVPLVTDVSSMFLSEPMDVSKFGLIYGGVQKNIGPAGVCIVIVRDDLVRDDVIENTPTYMRYATQVAGKSMHNTPPCWGIYICGLVFKWIKNLGGLEAMQKINEEKAAVLYDFLDSSELFKATADPAYRSIMNVPFVTGSDELDKLFIAGAKDHNIQNIKGHRSVGGMRASIYNAMPIEGVRALVEYMKEFEAQNA